MQEHEVEIQLFQNIVRLHFKLNGMTKCSSMVANILPEDPFLTLGIGQNSNFSEHGHAAYQIKGNDHMQQHGSNNFARRPLSDPAV